MSLHTHQSVTLSIGQVVSWRASPSGLAQIEDLGRRNVVVGYQRRGRWRRCKIPARVAAVLAAQILLQIHNPFGRAIRTRRERVFQLTEAR